MMAVGGFGTSVEKMFYILAGLAAGYAQLDQLNEPDKVRRSFVPEAQSGWTLKRG